MNITETLERSKSSEKIDFTKISCLNQDDPLVEVTGTDRIIVQPIWEVADDFEGRMYADYRKEHPDYDGIYVRSGLLERLNKAADALPEHYKLVVRAGHRPIAVQKRLLRDVMQDYKDDHPGASGDEALKHARMYVSDPDIKLPPHCCGAAVDVDLLNAQTGKMVDFGSPVNLDDDISHLHTDKITNTQQQNRMMLLRAMLGAGFASYYAEWWHYSYGDEIWAWFYGKNACLYDLLDK